jgi:hypothetical protein
MSNINYSPRPESRRFRARKIQTMQPADFLGNALRAAYTELGKEYVTPAELAKKANQSPQETALWIQGKIRTDEVKLVSRHGVLLVKINP